MSKVKVEVETVETNSGTMYSVRVIEKGIATAKAHCSSFAEADKIARSEAERLKVSVSYQTDDAIDARPALQKRPVKTHR